MIPQLFIGLCVAAVTGVIDLIPSMELSIAGTLSSFASYLGSQLNGLNSIIPIAEIKGPIASTMAVYIPFVLTFYVVRWVYSKIPVFGR
jgi:hypothetical protein